MKLKIVSTTVFPYSYFCGLNIDQIAPDHSTLSRFRTAMTKVNAYESLFKEINVQLESHGIIVKTRSYCRCQCDRILH